MYSILTSIHQHIKVGETMAEVMKHKKDLEILKMSEDEAIPVYTFSVVAPSLFERKITNKSDIDYLPTYVRWREKSLQKMLDPVHRDIKLIIAERYQRHPSLKALATEMALRPIEFVSDLLRWVDYTYESLISGGNVKEYVWWITTRVIRSIFEDYLAPARATSTRTLFGSDPHFWSTIVWGVIRCHLDEENIL